MGYYHPYMVDPAHDNPNNHEAVMIDRALYRAMVKLFALENEIIADIRAIWRFPND